MKKKRSVAPNGDAIRTARLRKAWTTEVLSGRADCAVKTVENAERGKAIYANTLASIASALGVDYESLVARPVEQEKPVEMKKPATELRKPRTLESLIPTGRVESVFFVLRREDRPIASDWFVDQLKSHVAIQDPIEVLEKPFYFSTHFFMPEGGVRIALMMTVRDFEEVFEYFTTNSNTDLKVVYLTAAHLPHPHKSGEYLWHAPSAWTKPPHSHLYG